MMRYQGTKKNFTLQEIKNREGDVIGSCVGILVGKESGYTVGFCRDRRVSVMFRFEF